MHGELDKLAAARPAVQDKLNRLKGLVTGSLSKDVFADADLVIEAVFEEMSVKQQVFAEVEAVVSPECVLATNTSALSVTEMASKLEHPERVVGLHFFNPVAVLPLLEVVRAEQTDDATLATAFAVGKALKKSCVLVADAPAFVVNRLLTRFLGEITSAVEQGTPVAVADRALDPLGLPMTPFDLLTLVGPPVALHVAERMHEAFPDRFAVGEGLKKMVELGKSSVYSEPGVVDPELEGIDAGDSPLTEDEVRERAVRGAGRGDPADARRGRRPGGAGHRPVHAARRRLAVLAGRHLRLPGPDRRLRGGHRRAVPAARGGLAPRLMTR